MLAAGFVGMPTEWWHFDAPDSGDYALSNEPL
jgi:D-alanyl-D-alanine dipeptidase